MNRCFSLASALAALVAPWLAGCGAPSAVSATTVTAATPPAPAAVDPAPEPAPEPATASDEAPASPPPFCRATDAFGVTTELTLAWHGGVADGVLRSEAPSGALSVTKLRAERRGGSIVADDVAAPYEDLVEHAVTVREANGKRYIRLGDAKQAWSLCD